MTTTEPEHVVSDDTYGLFIYLSYRISLDVLERFKQHKDPRIADQAALAYDARTKREAHAEE